MSLHMMICAAEPSGDALGAALMRSLRDIDDNIILTGCGGAEMKAEGLSSLFDIEPLSVIGPVDALRALPAANNGGNLLAHHVVHHKADAVVLIDSWAFSQLVAKKIRKISPATKIFKFVAPQIWASRPKRAKTLAKLFDGVLTLFDFEPAWFEPYGVKTAFCGHPGFQKMMAEKGGGDVFREKYSLGSEPLLLLAPGSRRSEIKWLKSPFRDAASILRKSAPDLRVVIPIAPGREEDVHNAFDDWDCAPIFIKSDEKTAAFDAATLGLVASGTTSTQLAIAGVPMVVGYAVDWLSAAWIKSVVTTRYASLVNIASGKEIIPEFLQEQCTAENLSAALLPLLRQSRTRAAQIEAFPDALDRLGASGPPAADVGARALIDWICGK